MVERIGTDADYVETFNVRFRFWPVECGSETVALEAVMIVEIVVAVMVGWTGQQVVACSHVLRISLRTFQLACRS